MSSPLNRPQIHPTSGLSFRWCEFLGRSGSTWDASFGHEGVGLGMVIMIYYQDLEIALQQLIGFSIRNPLFTPPRINRVLPFRHPRWNQLWCTKVLKVEGLHFTGKDEFNFTFNIGTQLGGPVATYEFLLLTLQFTRPPYAVLDDLAIINQSTSLPEEFRRFTDRYWTSEVQMLSREGMMFAFNDGEASGNQFPGSVGTPLAKLGLKRTWYQIPEQSIYDANGFPDGIVFGPVATDISNVADNGSGKCRVTSAGHGLTDGEWVTVTDVGGVTVANTTDEVDVISSSTFDLVNTDFSGSYTTGGSVRGVPMVGSVNSSTFFGCPAGTLLFEAPEINPKPLPLPPALMGITSESFQLQYDITFHFKFFDPPRGTGVTARRGHNLMPWAADGLWYPVGSVGKTGSVPADVPPFLYRDFNNLFNSL